MTAFNEKAVLDALPQPVLCVAPNRHISYANFAAQEFFGASSRVLQKQQIIQLMPFGSPVVGLIERCLDDGISFNEYGIDLTSPRTGADRMVDLHVSPS